MGSFSCIQTVKKKKINDRETEEEKDESRYLHPLGYYETPSAQIPGHCED